MAATAVAVGVVVVCAAWAVAAYGSGSVADALRRSVADAGARCVRARGDGWVVGFLRSPVTVWAGAAFLASWVAACLLIAALWRLGRAGGPRPPDAGTAAIEFALLFPLALTVVLILLQSMFVVAGNMAVHHGAFAAARSAIVWVPEKLSADEPRNQVTDPSASAKMLRIRSAAVYAVMPVSAGKIGAGGAGGAGSAAVVQDGLDRLHRFYGERPPNWIRTQLEGKHQYAWAFTHVRLDGPDDGQTYGDHEDLRVRVRHTLYLSIPYANAAFAAFGGGRSLGGGDYGTDVDVTYALPNEGVEDEIDVEQFPRYVGRGES